MIYLIIRINQTLPLSNLVFIQVIQAKNIKTNKISLLEFISYFDWDNINLIFINIILVDKILVYSQLSNINWYLKLVFH